MQDSDFDLPSPTFAFSQHRQNSTRSSDLERLPTPTVDYNMIDLTEHSSPAESGPSAQPATTAIFVSSESQDSEAPGPVPAPASPLQTMDTSFTSLSDLGDPWAVNREFFF